ncbi:late histone H2A [Culex quinquefasciatus]|uniref:Histone H2A n=1 Tax=Culex quinquefasciatus TaxID=7176 RepID=B0XL51_CULQU|nr:late histone H2A [Culex quinquefasciatus]|eukprot:XP_001870373.1 late histone H2A [Culex quinquefasciatus]
MSAKVKSASRTKSSRTGLEFPVGRCLKYLKAGNYANRIGTGASIYMAATLEYLVAEILELSGNTARDNKKSRIIPRHNQLAIRNDYESSQHGSWKCKTIVHQQTVRSGLTVISIRRNDNLTPFSGLREVI